MKILNKIRYGFFAVVVSASLTSCDSFLKEYSQDLAKVESWEDLDELLIGSAYMSPGSYASGIGSNYTQGTNLNPLHFMTDELEIDYGFGSSDYSFMQTEMFPYITWQKDTGVDENLSNRNGDEKYFNDFYNKISTCNQVLHLIDDQPVVVPSDATEKSRVKGEAHFLRGYYYFLLANMYCEPYEASTASSKMGMPLKLTPQIEDIEYKRGTLEETYRQILSDLHSAETELEGTIRTTFHQANQTAARLLLARIYLYMQDYDNAREYASLVLHDNVKLLNLSSFPEEGNFMGPDNPEIIFTMGDYDIARAFTFTPYSTPLWAVCNDIIDLYGENDIRKIRFFKECGSFYKNPRCLAKYNGPVGTAYTAGSVATFRTSEAYLILAEAESFLGNESEARSILEKFLATRLSGDATVTKAGNELIDFIRDERTREFLLEGHRWFDLRRYTVCVKYPFSKAIVHGYPYADEIGYGNHYEWYKLLPDDVAYTLAIPREILQFQPSLGTVIRPDRKPFRNSTPTLDYSDENEND